MPRDGSDCIRAVVRVRPLLASELDAGETNCCEVPDATSLLIRAGPTSNHWRQYAFDACLPSDYSQKQVFQECGVTHLLDSAIEGYSATVLAYGQTGSGKTHTMMGRLGTSDGRDGRRDEGLMMRAARRLFKRIGDAGASSDLRYSVRVSFTEIYNAPGAVNECICDLMRPANGNLHIRHSQKNGFFVSDLELIDCASIGDVRAVLETGIHNRRAAPHALNTNSSRSHALFTLHIDSEGVGGGESRHGKITFVDLAGSERLKESLSEGNAMKETQAINKSLFTLGAVISQLAHGKAAKHVPYRNSKLTQLLQESFGGDALCLMVACISPASVFVEESVNSLNYAQKAMNIQNRPVVRMDEHQQLVHDLRSENAALRRELEGYRGQHGDVEQPAAALPPELPLPRDAPQESSRRATVGHDVRPAEDVLAGAVQLSRSLSPRRRSRHRGDASTASGSGTPARGRSAPAVEEAAPAPAPLLPAQRSARMPPAAPGSAGSYAAAAAKRRMQLSQPPQQAAPRRPRPGLPGRPLPPLPRQAASDGDRSAPGSASAASRAETIGPEVLQACASDGGSSTTAASGPRPELRAHGGASRAVGAPPPPLPAGPLAAPLADGPAVGAAAQPRQRPPPVPVIRAPPSQRSAAAGAPAAREGGHAPPPLRAGGGLASSGEPQLATAQLERLALAPWAEWQVDFGGGPAGPAGVAASGGPPSAPSPAGAAQSRGGRGPPSRARGSSRSGRSSSGSRRASSRSGQSTGSGDLSHAASQHSAARGSRPGSARSSAHSSASGDSALTTGREQRSTGPLPAEPPWAARPPLGAAPGEQLGGHSREGPALSELAELQEKLSSMQMATRSLLRVGGGGPA